jgi:hypothetical protein
MLLIAGVGVAFAQTADDYFHMASQQYINGDYTTSKRTVEQALKQFPNDPKLLALKRKIKEPPKQDQNQQQQNQQQNQQQQQKQQPKPQPQQGQISRDQADRMLQALQNKEKENLKKQQRPAEQEKVGKDW